MFKAYTTRHNGCPWGTSGQTSATWLDIPLTEVSIADLVATQTAFFFHALMDHDWPHMGTDPHPHVILWDGTYYVEDGHHRVIKAILAGRETIPVRLLSLGPAFKNAL